MQLHFVEDFFLFLKRADDFSSVEDISRILQTDHSSDGYISLRQINGLLTACAIYSNKIQLRNISTCFGFSYKKCIFLNLSVDTGVFLNWRPEHRS